MIFRVRDDAIVIISEDPMDAAYLESLFAGSVHVSKESNLIRHGFHVTDERSVQIKIAKGE